MTITDYMRSVPDQVSRFVDRPYGSLGTDGFGRSDNREALRSYFEVDAAHLVVAVLHQLAEAGRIDRTVVKGAIDDLGIEPAPGAPFTLVSMATKVARTSSAPSGTRNVSVRASAARSTETSKKAQHAFSR